MCCGEPHVVLPRTYEVICELREIEVVEDARPGEMGNPAQGFFVIDVNGKGIVVPDSLGQFTPQQPSV